MPACEATTTGSCYKGYAVLAAAVFLILMPSSLVDGTPVNLIFPFISLGKSSLNFIFGFACGKYHQPSHEETCFTAIKVIFNAVMLISRLYTSILDYCIYSTFLVLHEIRGKDLNIRKKFLSNCYSCLVFFFCCCCFCSCQ